MSVLGHWVWLSTVSWLTPGAVSSLLETFGSPLEVYNASESALSAVPGLSAAALSALLSKDMAEAEAVIADCARLGVTIVTRQDAAYPERLAAISDPPAVLYVKGKLPPLDGCPAIAVVGTRNASAYGLSAAKRLAFDLASAGVIVVSGMALGCDAAAHSGAIEAGKPTVAVLGCGPDVCYPSENHALFNDIPRTGAIVSEYPPGTKPNAMHFPVRNRIISGLSNGVLVAEADADSGALITAGHALEQGREVYAVPGNIDSPLSAGTNALIKQGARLVTCSADILADLVPLFNDYFSSIAPGSAPFPSGADLYTDRAGGAPVKLYRPPGKPENPPESGDDLDGRILELLKNGDMLQDDIILALGGRSSEVNAALTMLEIGGRIVSKPGNIFGL